MEPILYNLFGVNLPTHFCKLDNFSILRKKCLVMKQSDLLIS